MPSFKGESVSTAESFAKNNNLTIEIEYKNDPDEIAGIILDQSVAPGTLTNQISGFTIYVNNPTPKEPDPTEDDNEENPKENDENDKPNNGNNTTIPGNPTTPEDPDIGTIPGTPEEPDDEPVNKDDDNNNEEDKLPTDTPIEDDKVE